MKKILPTFTALIVVTLMTGMSFASWIQHGIDGSFPEASAVVARDLDGDGDPDVVGASLNGVVNWYENDGTAQFTGHLVAGGITNARHLRTGDLDGDEDMDLVVGCEAGWPEPFGLYRLMNDGAMQFSVVQMTSEYRFYDLVVHDMDEDGDLDIVGTHSLPIWEVLSWWENRENGQIFVEHTILTDTRQGFGAADMDHDGDMDLVICDDTSILWLENNGDQTFTSHTVGTGLSSNDVNAGDLDSDGDLDVLARQYNSLRWYHNDGNQNFSVVSEIPTPLWVHEIQVMEVDGDGCMDISYISGTWGYVWWTEDFLCRAFQGWTLSQPSVGTVSYDTCDFNGDGRVDFAVTGTSDANNITWYENPLSPTVKLQIAPLNPPIVIPPQGGEFSFAVWVWNTTSDTLLTDLWTAAESYYDHFVEPIIMIPDVTLEPDTLITRQLTQRVPANVPPNSYVYTVKVGDCPHYTVDSEDFSFTKERDDGDVGSVILDRSSTGDSFTEEASEFRPPPSDFSLLVSPNPFNPTTAISYQLSGSSHVHLAVYSLNGQMVAELINGWRDAGCHEVTWDASDKPSGLYLCHIKAGDFSQTQKMILLK